MSTNNADMFGSSSSSGGSVAEVVESTQASGNEVAPAGTPDFMSRQRLKYVNDAERLRQEAAEMEIALREEARAKGLPEEMVNKLVPPPRMPGAPKSVSSSSGAVTSESQEDGSTLVETKTNALSVADLRAKLGYLNTGDAIRITSELDRLKAKGNLRIWNSKKLDARPNFAVSNGQLTTKTKIDPIKLRLDDVGYNYQKVFGIALAIGTVFGLSSSTIGGELGFILGYLSALLPIMLVGVGSVAPALIFDVLSSIKYATDADARNRYAHMQAGKFLVGYALGLPVSRFDAGGPASAAQFFQLRPQGTSDADDRRMFSKKTYTQVDIAPASAMCVGGPVAECMIFGEASGNTPADVNTLNDIMGRVEPTISTDVAQNHIRWSAVTAYQILSENKDAYLKLVEAIKAGMPLEECIAALEGEGPLVIM